MPNKYDKPTEVDVSKLLKIWSIVKEKYNGKSFGSHGYEENGSTVTQKGCSNPIVGDIPWNSPKDILWLSSENYCQFEGMDDYYDGHVYGVDKYGRIIWIEYKFNYFAHFNDVLKFFNENPRILHRELDILYDKPGYYKTLDVRHDVFVDVFTFHGDPDEFMEKISSIVKNESVKACR